MPDPRRRAVAVHQLALADALVTLDATLMPALNGASFGIVWLGEDGRASWASATALRMAVELRSFALSPVFAWLSASDAKRFATCWEDARTAQALFRTGQLLVTVKRTAVSTFPGLVQWPGVVMLWHRRYSVAPHPEILRRAFKLSVAEARLACRLVEHRSLAAASNACGIASTTARGYLKQIFAKTATRRQAELIGLLMAFAALNGPEIR
jgi:DNA-binding CsgD family transcriptional regulator